MIAPYKRSWCVVGSRQVAEIAPAASGGLLRETTAGEESRTEGGDKTKIHELIVGENLSRQWGEPHSCGLPWSSRSGERASHGSLPIVPAESSDSRLALPPCKQRTTPGQPEAYRLGRNPPFVFPCHPHISTDRTPLSSVALSQAVYAASGVSPHHSYTLLLQSPRPDSSETGGVRRLTAGVRSSEHVSLQP
jgi:hypothetical protein